MPPVLLVDDDVSVLNSVGTVLRKNGYTVHTAMDGETALAEISRAAPHVILLDLNLPGKNGLEVLEQIRRVAADSAVIMFSGRGGVGDAVHAMKLGAFDYLPKPASTAELLLAVQRATEHATLRRELARTQALVTAQASAPGGRVMGESPAIRKVLEMVRMVGPSNLSVIIQGESGVGKEVIAHLIHEHSYRRDRVFVPVDCGTIPDTLAESLLFGHEKGSFTGADHVREGEFERANGGTIFLDEIVNTSEAIQMKLLRVVQEKGLRHLGGKHDIALDVRIICASNVPLSEAVHRKLLRADLYHRLNEFVIHVPPLRERRDDILVLARQFLLEANVEMQKDVKGFAPEAVRWMLESDWPGNVRELRNAVRRALLLATGDSIRLEDLSFVSRTAASAPSAAPPEAPASLKGKVNAAREEIEKAELVSTLQATGGNKARAARLLKIDRVTLYTKMRQYGLFPPATAD